MKEYISWKQETFPVNFDRVGPLLKSGFLYVSKRDRSFRPIIILNVQKIVDADFPVDLLQESTSFFCDFVVKKLLIPGLVENWIMVIDLGGIGISSLPVKKVKGIVQATQKYFGGRLYRQFCINMGWMMRKSAGLFLSFVDEITQQKISFHDDSNYRQPMGELVALENLEKKYGGHMPNIDANFFPPNMDIQGTRMMNVNELKTEYPDAEKYVSPWGQQKADRIKQEAFEKEQEEAK